MNAKRIIITVILYVVLFALITISANANSTYLGAGIALVCAFFGWRTLNMIQPAMFIWMPLMGWIIYIIVKFILSYLIGLFVAPFIIGKAISDAIGE